MNKKTISDQLEELLEEPVYLSSERELERNREAYRNTILKEAKRLQKNNNAKMLSFYEK